MKQVLSIDIRTNAPDSYTRIVKPYDNQDKRLERIDWCRDNCEKKFKATIGSRIVLSAELEHEYDRRPGEPPNKTTRVFGLDNKTTRELLHILFFECERDAIMFSLSN